MILSADLYRCKLGIFDERTRLNLFLWNRRTKFDWDGFSVVPFQNCADNPALQLNVSIAALL